MFAFILFDHRKFSFVDILCDGPDDALVDFAVRSDQIRGRQRLDLVLIEYFLRAVKIQEADFIFLQKQSRVVGMAFRSRDVHAEHHRIFLLLRKCLQMRHLGLARRTPAGPEIQEDLFPSVIGKFHRIAIHILQFKIVRDLSDVDACLGFHHFGCCRFMGNRPRFARFSTRKVAFPEIEQDPQKSGPQ